MRKEEGFEGSYYHAIVVTGLDKDDYIVQFTSLLRDDGSGPLRQVHNLAEIRPIPPEIPVSKLDLSARVDAYHAEGWWAGTVVGVRGLKYTVYFDESGEELSFALRSLRVHQDWVNGEWILGKKKRGRRRKIKV